VVFFLMLASIRHPLPASSPFAPALIPLRLVVPHLRTALTFFEIAGPILGVIAVKVLIFGMVAAKASAVGTLEAAAHQILFSAAPITCDIETCQFAENSGIVCPIIL
jgi:hypothetical protein